MNTSNNKGTLRNSSESKNETRRFNTAMVHRIEGLIKENNMTSKQLGAELGINASTFGKYFSLTSKMPCDVVCAIAQFFGVSVDYLFGITQSETNTPLSFDMLTTINLSESAIDQLTSIHPDRLHILDELLESGIMDSILGLFMDYKDDVLSDFVDYYSSPWYRSLAENIQSGIDKLPSIHADSPCEMEQLLNTIEDMPDGEDRTLAFAFYALLCRAHSPNHYQHFIKKIKYESGFQLVELLSEYGASSLRRCSDKALKEKIEHRLLEVLQYNHQLADKLYDSADRPPIEKARNSFYPSV